MRKLLRFFLLLFLPLAAWTQTPSDFRLDQFMVTPLNSPQDIVVNAQGHMYVLDNGYVTELDSLGHYLQRMNIKSTNPAQPNSIGSCLAMDLVGNFYVGDFRYGQVRKYTAAGQLLFTFGVPGTQQGQIDGLRSLTVDITGNIYLTDAQRLKKFNAQGQFQWQFTPTNIHYGAPARPIDVDAGRDGRLFLVQSDANILEINPATGAALATVVGGSPSNQYGGSLARDAAGNFYTRNGSIGPIPINKYSPQGAYLGSFGYSLFDYSAHTALAVDSRGNIYATNDPETLTATCKLYKFNAALQEVGRWGKVTRVDAIAFDHDGNYCVADGKSTRIIKYDAAGRELFRFGGYGTQTGQFQSIMAVAFDAQNNIYVSEYKNNFIRIQKFDAQGRFLRLLEKAHPNGNSTRISGLAIDPVGCIYVVDYWRCIVVKLNPQGQQLLTFGSPGTQAGQFEAASDVAVDGRGFVYVADRNGQRVQKFSPSGQFLRQNDASTPGTLIREWPVGFCVDAAGTVFLGNAVENLVRVYSPNGATSRVLPGAFSYLGRLAVNRQGTRLLMVDMYSDLVSSHVAVNPPNYAYPEIKGRIYQDLNNDCVAQSTEPGIPGIVVVANPGNYYGLSDEEGKYTIAADTGSYTVSQLLPTEPGRVIQASCAVPPAVRLASNGATQSGLDFGNHVSTAPYLSVRVGANRRRRCFRSTTTVTYSNMGFATAANAQVKVALPQYLVFISASAPHTRDPQGNYVFSVGTLAPGTHGTILIQDSVVCGNPAIRGLTVCTQATITPPNTYPQPPTWNRASVTVKGRAQAGNQVRFVLRNPTANAMTDSLAFRLYQNSELSLQHNYLLGGGDSLVLRVPATRPVVRVEADQPTGHPTQRVASSTVEVATLSTAGQPNPDMASMAPNLPGPEFAEDCQPITDSFDPNDKQVTPTGTTAQHYTPTGVPLHYQIRFQNTGTDDAYQVAIVDTLSSDLDLHTLRLTTSSHPCHLTVTGHGRPVLTFTFDNINLPPSTRNEAGSNGFVQFTIQPKAGLTPRTLIENNADIFFDYNPPVRTNTTTNRIYDQPVVVVPVVALNYPNVLASPVLTQFVPAQGRAGTLVTLTGQRFSPNATANTVRFNGVAAPVLSATATTLTARVPATASTGTIQVITGEGAGRSTQAFTVFQPPTLATVVPAEGRPGDVVTLTGTQFSPVAAQDTVWFNGVRAVVQQASATALQVVVPAGATAGKIRINTLGGQVVSTQDFVVWYPPALVSFSPSKGKAGTIVTLTGSNFAPTARNVVTFGTGVAAVTLASATSVQVRVPAGAQTGPIQVQTPGGTSVSASAFTFLPAPVISSFAPAQASVGEVVQLTGLNFLVEGQPDTISFGGASAAVLAATATTATVRVPKGALSGPLTIAGTGGRNNSPTAFTLLALSAAESINVYPNPAHGMVTIDWQLADFEVSQVKVYNALGALVANQDLSSRATPTLPLQFDTGKTGLYLLLIETSRGTVLKRMTLY